MTLYQAVRARVLYFESFAIQALGGRVFSKYVAEFQILYPFIVKEIKVVTFLVEIEMQPQNLS